MRGNNTLELNEATLIEAVQEYLDKRMTVHSPKVTSIKSSKVGLSDGFTVRVEERSSSNGDGKL